jgi:HEAT repeat protein
VASQAPAPNQPDSNVNTGENSLEMMEALQQEGVLTDQASDDQKKEMSSRRQTINNLITIGDSASVMAMAEYTRDADKEMRKLAVTGISLIQSEESTQVLGQVLQDESDPEIRRIALRALSQRQNDVAAQALLEGALNDADPEATNLSDQMLTE